MRKYRVIESSIKEICGFCGQKLIAYCVHLGGGQWACHDIASGVAILQTVEKPSLDEVFVWLSGMAGVTNITASGLRADIYPSPCTQGEGKGEGRIFQHSTSST
ncbi:MAG: hypothetical protein IT447_15470 [Phycisphaerales bacterium]|nr:hypothetical protein [Phycisphaerales bacterium]